MADCGICCEKLNKSNRKEINCVFCDYIVCRTCFQKYTLETSLDPHCMNCKKTFNYDFVSNNCTSIFITKHLKTHRENILFDREKSLLPETQPYVVVEHRKKEINNDIKVLADQRYELQRKIRALDTQINVLYSTMSRVRIDNVSDEPADERKKFIRKCPMNDCRGFLSSQWKCGSCESKICNLCNEEKVNDHRCNPENVASMELLNKDTKPCPSCGTMIFRISGCPQMFCVDCHTAWDWNTSRVISGVIHNPHYYEFINRGGGSNRNHADIPCGGLPDAHQLRQTIIGVYGNNPSTPSFLLNFHQAITHIEHHELRHHVINNGIEVNRPLRVKYLMNQLSEIDFKSILQQNEKRREKTIAFHNIYQMFVNVSSDILRQIVLFCRDNTRGQRTFFDENILLINNLIIYFNENIKKIGKQYKVVYPGITPAYKFVSNIKNLKET